MERLGRNATCPPPFQIFKRSLSSQPRNHPMAALRIMARFLVVCVSTTSARSLGFSAGFSSGMVLQRGTSKTAMYGYGGDGKVTVDIDGVDGNGAKSSYSVSTNANKCVCLRAYAPHCGP